jgi:hypothetical protein
VTAGWWVWSNVDTLAIVRSLWRRGRAAAVHRCTIGAAR